MCQRCRGESEGAGEAEVVGLTGAEGEGGAEDFAHDEGGAEVTAGGAAAEKGERVAVALLGGLDSRLFGGGDALHGGGLGFGLAANLEWGRGALWGSLSGLALGLAAGRGGRSALGGALGRSLRLLGVGNAEHNAAGEGDLNLARARGADLLA